MNFKNKVIHAFLWASSAKIISQVFSWAVSILLARLLLPDDFGLIAMAWIFIGFLDLINEVGVGAAIIQREDLDEEDLHSTFWFSVFFGVFLYFIVFFLAPTIAVFFDNNQLIDILRILSLIFIIDTFKTVPFNLLTRELVFAKRSIAEFFSIFSGGAFSIALAISGYGVWSLVYGTLLRKFVLTALILYAFPWKPRLIFSFKKFQRILNFGISVMMFRVFSYLYSNLDSLIIGKVLGDRLLGFYSVAFQLSIIPVQKVTAIVNQVAFPVFSKLQDDKIQLSLYFLKITRFVSLVTFPCMIGLFLVSENLITVVLTEKWLPALVPFRILCIFGLLRSIDAIIPSLLLAKGKPHIVLRYNLLCFMTLPISFLIGVRYGVDGVAYAWIIVYPVLLIYLFRRGLIELDISFSHYLRNLSSSIVASAFMALIVLAFQFGEGVLYGESVHLTLVGSCLSGAIGYLTFLVFFYDEVISEVKNIYYSLKIKQLNKAPI